MTRDHFISTCTDVKKKKKRYETGLRPQVRVRFRFAFLRSALEPKRNISPSVVDTVTPVRVVITDAIIIVIIAIVVRYC